jgi:hypothetical protein
MQGINLVFPCISFGESGLFNGLRATLRLGADSPKKFPASFPSQFTTLGPMPQTGVRRVAPALVALKHRRAILPYFLVFSKRLLALIAFAVGRVGQSLTRAPERECRERAESAPYKGSRSPRGALIAGHDDDRPPLRTDSRFRRQPHGSACPCPLTWSVVSLPPPSFPTRHGLRDRTGMGWPWSGASIPAASRRASAYGMS